MRLLTVLVPLLGWSVALGAQSPAPDITGTWRAETPDGPTDVIVRSDSTASLGEETVRWRTVGDSIHLALGDEWVVYAFAVAGAQLTLSGGDLEEPMYLRRIGPATPRPAGVPIPKAPPGQRRADP